MKHLLITALLLASAACQFDPDGALAGEESSSTGEEPSTGATEAHSTGTDESGTSLGGESTTTSEDSSGGASTGSDGEPPCLTFCSELWRACDGYRDFTYFWVCADVCRKGPWLECRLDALHDEGDCTAAQRDSQSCPLDEALRRRQSWELPG
jgi:hypothetical protein